MLTLISAPERSSLAIIYSERLTSSASVMRLVWMLKIRRFVFSSGNGNSIFRSIRPKKRSACIRDHKGRPNDSDPAISSGEVGDLHYYHWSGCGKGAVVERGKYPHIYSVGELLQIS